MPFRRAAIAAAQAAVEGIAAIQRHRVTVYALQQLHAAVGAGPGKSAIAT
jgi:hypothetical protein